ncbi:hypothetical protein FQR65_LT05709 [Abscondita terminalis]|nr:hypothetical protein FQR65_LT05709 [Abscondita terminalis]
MWLNTHTHGRKQLYSRVILILFGIIENDQFNRYNRRKHSLHTNDSIFDRYLRYVEIQNYLAQEAKNHQDLVEVEGYGLSYEKRSLTLIKISSGGDDKKPMIFVDAGMHGREWLGPAQALYIIDQLLNNPENKKLIEKVDWIIIPLLNPDGYEYAHTKVDRHGENTIEGKMLRVDLIEISIFIGQDKVYMECSNVYAGPILKNLSIKFILCGLTPIHMVVNNCILGVILILFGIIENDQFNRYNRRKHSLHTNDSIFDRYLRYVEIQNYLAQEAKNHQDLVEVEGYGLSYEKRSLTLIKISSGGDDKKPMIFVDAGMHGREWLGPAQALYIIDQLLNNPENKKLIEKVDWIIIPLLNPDGYEYAHTKNRSWRKTRSKGKDCYGVDPNRNFDFHWSGQGSSNMECSNVYAGPKPFSEPETLALSKTIFKYSDRIKLYLTFHTPLQCLLYPYGYTNDLPKNVKELHNLGVKVAESIYAINNTKYKVGTSVQIFTHTAGSSRDWVYGVAKINLSYTIELPAAPGSSHEMPANNILRIVAEMFEVVFILLQIITAFSEKVTYKNFKTYRIEAATEDQMTFLLSLEGNKEVQYWDELKEFKQQGRVMITPQYYKEFEKNMLEHNINFELIIEDVGRVIEEEQISMSKLRPLKKGEVSFDRYLRYSEIQDYLGKLAVDHHDVVTVENYGLSYEGRNLTFIKISTGGNDKRPIMFIDAGIHAREWLGPAQALYIIDQLLDNPNNKNLIDNIDWVIIPLLNPDGYEYTHTVDRLWRKTRSKGIKCDGVDPNRNFDFHWSETGGSTDECSNNYAGPKAFSEPETLALSKVITRFSNRAKLYASFHTPLLSLLYPYGYTAELPPNNDELLSLGLKAADSIYAVAQTKYKVGTSVQIFTYTSGSSRDWAYGVANISLSYTMELPPSPQSSHEMPPDKILGVVVEMFEGVKTFHEYVENKYKLV